MGILQVTILVWVFVLKQSLTLTGLTPGHASVFRLVAVVSHCLVWSLPEQ